MSCLAKVVAISRLRARVLDENRLEGVSARFPLRDLVMLHRRETLHMCEQDSMVWVHFCMMEILMWWIYSLNSCICGSEREEERRASLSITNRLAGSMRLGIMLGR